MRVLVTGAAGFIGYHVCEALLARGDQVVGIDNLNDYYDVRLKQARLARLRAHPDFLAAIGDLGDRAFVEEQFRKHRPQRVVNLAAQAGVRYAAENPHVYVQTNIVGFLHIIEGCRHYGVEHLVYASSSSVYGANTAMPFSEHQSTEHPLTLYAATKKANEMMAHSYANLYGLPCTGLRFFTVYGPWGRPDMALFLFTRAILAGEPVKLFNGGRHRRSFTYIDDIVAGVVRTLDAVPAGAATWSGSQPDPATSAAPYRIFNIGSTDCVDLSRYIELIERCLGRQARREMLPLQPGDIPDSHADCADLAVERGYEPRVTVEQGVPLFVEWYRGYYRC